MAIVTIVATGNVSRMFADCRRAVMAGTASADNLCVVYSVGRYPGIRIMAILANITRLNVRRVLAGGIRTVVAANAIACNIDVIKVRG